MIKEFFVISWFYWIHLKILEKMRSYFWKLKLGFWTYGLIHFLGPIGPNVVSRPQKPKSNFFEISWFYWIISWFLGKWGPACGKWSYGSGLMAKYVFWAKWPKCRPQGQKMRFHNFTRFISWFLIKWSPAFVNWSKGSRLMAWYVFWTQLAQM